MGGRGVRVLVLNRSHHVRPCAPQMVVRFKDSQTRWRAVNAPHLVALVRAGVTFEKGVMVERSDGQAQVIAA